jgi:hypothetical protein
LVQGLLYIIQLIAIILFCLLTLLFFILAIVKRKKQIPFIVYVSLAVIFLVALFLTWRIDLFGAETSDREKSIGAFEDNFGFKPPDSIKEIKHKNSRIYDTDTHWMAFTYDSIVLAKILIHDQPLDTAWIDTQKYIEINLALKKGAANGPDWLEQPKTNTPIIYFKENFLKASYSEYQLWVDKKEKMVYLHVSYFD